MIYKRVVFPALRRLDPEQVHDVTISWLSKAQDTPFASRLLRLLSGSVPSRPVRLFGLEFPNPLGVAAGFDKDARVAQALAHLGFGHVEVGTLTPRPQKGNPKPRLFRFNRHGALINRMGFPNCGVDEAVARLQALQRVPREFVLGVSLGMQKETPLAAASKDYIQLMQAIYPYADYMAINISSPNTPGLRELQSRRYLDKLLSDIQEENGRLAAQRQLSGPKPLLVKISPDLSNAALDELLEVAADKRVAGIIATNTTLKRSNVKGNMRADQPGGLSGAPLRERSDELIAYIHGKTGGKLPIVGVGGVRSAADVQRKISCGAKLVQLYTGLVYEGPGLAGRIMRSLA